MNAVIEKYESEVRNYCRTFPVTFEKAEGSYLFDTVGRSYLDFFSGAGALNYGHNNPKIKNLLLEYIQNNGITHSLDLFTKAKQDFLESFNKIILEPRGMSYKIQFPGPTGTNAVEAALKLARKFKGRKKIAFFTNAFHGMTLGSLAVTSNPFKRVGAGVPLDYTFSLPFDSELVEGCDSLSYIEAVFNNLREDDKPAAVILETVQAEGGVNVASFKWLKCLSELLNKHGILLIVDDIQVGCGRTGSFFSFEPSGIKPDIICLSKSLSGYGLPLAITLIKPELDIWKPGEHNGTFRGFNLAFITATAALNFWSNKKLEDDVNIKAEYITSRLQSIASNYAPHITKIRGRGLIQALCFSDHKMASAISKTAFGKGLLIETAGSKNEVLKLLPPLTISKSDLDRGLSIIEKTIDISLCVQKVCNVF